MSKRAPHRRADAPRRGRPTRSMPRPRTSSRHSARSGLDSAWAPEPVSFLHCRQRDRLAHRAVPRRLDRCAQVVRDAVTNFEVYLEKASRRSSSTRQTSMAIHAVASFLYGPLTERDPEGHGQMLATAVEVARIGRLPPGSVPWSELKAENSVSDRRPHDVNARYRHRPVARAQIRELLRTGRGVGGLPPGVRAGSRTPHDLYPRRAAVSR